MGVGAAIAIGLAGAAVAGGGAYMASKGSGQTRNLGGEIGGMPTDQYRDQLEQMSDVDFENRFKQAMLTKSLYPQFARLQREEQAQQNKQALTWYPRFAAAEREQTGLQRRQDYSDFSELGGRYAELFGDLAPSYSRLEEETSAPRDTRILDRLRGDALSELDLSGRLSPDEMRDVIQGSRAAYSDRGIYDSNPALVSEVLNRGGATRARRNEGRQFAMGVQNMEEASDSNRINQLIAASQARLSPILGAAGTRSGVNPAISAGPASLAAAPGSVSNILASGPSTGMLSGSLSPLYSYGLDVNNTNFNAGESRAMAGANAMTAAGGGMMSAGAGMYGSRMKYGGGGGSTGGY